MKSIVQILTLFFVIGCTVSARGQSGEKEEIDSLNTAANLALQTDLELSWKLANETYKRSKQIGYGNGVSASLIVQSSYYRNRGSYDTAVYILEQCIILDSAEQDEERLSISKGTLAGIHRLQGNYVKAAALFYESLHLAELVENERLQLSILNNLAIIYEYTADSVKAEECYLAGLDILGKTGTNETFLSYFYSNLAGVYIKYPGLIKDKEYTVILEYLTKARNIGINQNNEHRVKEVDLQTILYYISIENYGKGEKLAIGALEFFEKNHFKHSEMNARSLLVEIYLETNQLDKALEEADLFIAIATELNAQDALISALEFKAKILVAKDDYELGFEYLEKSQLLYDSVFNHTFQKELIDVEHKYNLAQKRTETLELENEVFIQESNTRRLKHWLIATIALLELILIISITLFQLRRARKKLEINNLNISILTVQMNPHFTFNILNSIQNMILSERNAEASKYLVEFAGFLRKTMDYSAEQLISLKKEIEFIQLYLDLEKLRFKERLTFDISMDKTVTSTDIKVPPLLLQPFIENAIVHGFSGNKQGHIDIQITPLNPKEILIRIVDNGIGLDASSDKRKKIKKKSLGVALSRKRLQNMSSKNTIEILPNKNESGVQVIIHLRTE